MQPQETAREQRNRATKILVVDDEEVIRQAIAEVLKSLSYEVIEASNGTEAVHFAHEQKPDLILLDIMMPKQSGIDVCQRLRADRATRDIRIIVVTGLNAKEALEESIIAGADDFLTKPIDTLELVVRVRSMLRVRNIQDDEKRLEAYVKNLQTMRRDAHP